MKTTTTDRARMTPKQAETAASHAEKYVLCVVDLRGVSEERFDQPWSKDDVLRLARITGSVGGQVRETWHLVEQARTGTVTISGDSSLRYEIPASVWGEGCNIEEWLLATWGKTVPPNNVHQIENQPTDFLQTVTV